MGCIQQIDALITGWHHWTNNTKNYFPSQFSSHVGAYCTSFTCVQFEQLEIEHFPDLNLTMIPAS
jgi:hypothetical protein